MNDERLYRVIVLGGIALVGGSVTVAACSGDSRREGHPMRPQLEQTAVPEAVSTVPTASESAPAPSASATATATAQVVDPQPPPPHREGPPPPQPPREGPPPRPEKSPKP